MKRILVIQSRTAPEMITAEQESFRRSVTYSMHIDFISSLDESYAWNVPHQLTASYGAVILAGSGDFDFDGGRTHDDDARRTSYVIAKRLRELVLFAIESDFPLLGICYGHQIVSEVLSVPVVNDHGQKKVGSHHVFLTPEGKQDPIFSGLPEKFVAQYGHKDSLSCVPPGAVLLAKSDCCKTSALRFGSRVYTMQFHPELTHEELSVRLKNLPGFLPEGANIESFVQPSHEASKIIPSFIRMVA